METLVCGDCGTELVSHYESGPACPRCEAVDAAVRDVAEASVQLARSDAKLGELEAQIAASRAELMALCAKRHSAEVDAEIDRELDKIAQTNPELAAAAKLIRDARPPSEISDARAVIAKLASRAVQDIDEGRIKLTGEAAERELARLAEEKHAAAAGTFGERPDDLTMAELVTCPRCDQRMTRARPHSSRAFGGAEEWTCACGLSCTAEGARSEHVRAGFAQARRHAAEAATVPNEKEQAALAFCFRAAAGDSGGQRRVRQFLFAWHNAGELGGFDFADLWSLDEKHLDAVLTLIRMIARGQTGYYPHHYGYEADMEALIETYGPVRS